MHPTPDDLFKALADPTRLRCLLLLLQEGELCVCELTQALSLSQPKISRHLALLRETGIATDRREGVWIHYRLSPDLPAWSVEVLRAARQDGGQKVQMSEDLQRLKAMQNRPRQRREGASADPCD